MKITGIIAEYNPFHNGHKYHLEQTRRLTNADFLIAVIGGDFLQRGTPAVTDKHTRTQMALLNGADLVLELPLYYAAGSAEFFSMGAVTLLDKLGSVDALCFGSECGDIQVMSDIASVLLHEPEDFRKSLQKELKKGYSFPKARSMALTSYLDCSGIISSPNNILGIEYLKALLKRNSNMKPCTITRQGNDYHDDLLNNDNTMLHTYSSAAAIRKNLTQIEDLTFPDSIQEHVPASVLNILKKDFKRNFPIDSNDFSLLLRYCLLMSFGNYDQYLDISSDLSDKIEKNLNYFIDYEQFCGLLKSKDMTYSRLSRGLLHILLGMTTRTMDAYIRDDYIYYARILGFRKDSALMLRHLKNNSSIPLISKLADASSYLEGHGLSMLKDDIRAAHIYDSAAASKYGTTFVNEYSKELVII